MIVQGNGTELLGPLALGQIKTASFDFSVEAAAAASIASATVSIAWVGGVYDAAPNATLSGSASTSGYVVTQAFTGQVAGAVYSVTVTATDSEGDQHTITAQLAVDISAAAAAWSEFHTFVLDEAKECPVFLIDQHLRTAAKEFFSKSHAWRSQRATLFTTVAGQAAYRLAGQANAEVQQVHSAWLGTTRLTVRLPGAEDDDTPGVTTTTPTIGVEPGSIARLSPPPTTGGVAVVGTVSFVPTEWAIGIPRELFVAWGREIAAHAAACLVAQPNKPWSNPSAYARLMAKFNSALARAGFDAGPVRAGNSAMRVKPCR